MMDTNLVYVKTPIGDEAIRQSTRVVQRNLRMILVQVDGKLSVAELSNKFGNRQLVETALRTLEADGYIAPTMDGVSVWEEGVRQAREQAALPLSEFSTFGSLDATASEQGYSRAMASSFSTFGKSKQRPAAPIAKVRNSTEKNKKPMPSEEKAPGFSLKSFRWARFFGVTSLGALLFGFLGLIFYPYDHLRPRIEAAASGYLQMPVVVGAVRLQIFPKPLLILSDLKLGEQKDACLDYVGFSPLSLLGSSRRAIGQVSVSGASLSVEDFLKLPGVGSRPQNPAADFLINRLVVDKLAIRAGDFVLDGLQGDVIFAADGVAKKLAFETVDRNIRLAAMPGPAGLNLDIETFGWRPFSGVSVSFDSLQAKGLLQPGKLLVEHFDTTLLGGVVKGSWLLDWTKGMTMAGDASLARLDVPKVMAAFMPKLVVDGELSGQLRLRGAGENLTAMWRQADADVEIAISNGAVHGVDLGGAMRRGAGSVVRGGSTKFEQLVGSLSIRQGQVLGRNIQLKAGMMAAHGQFSVVDQRVDALMTVTMQTSVSTQRSPVKIRGGIADLSAMTVAQ